VTAQLPSQKSNSRDFALAEHGGELAPAATPDANGATRYSNPLIATSNPAFSKAPITRERALFAKSFMIQFPSNVKSSGSRLRAGAGWRKIAVTA
jgi:hypothetical protein